MVDWSLAQQVARLAAGQGTEDAAAVRRRCVCRAEMEGSVAGYTGLALSHADAAGRGREPRRVGVGEPRLAVADPRPGGRAAGRPPRVRGAAGGRAANRSVGHGGRRGRPRDGLPVLAGARPVRRLAAGRRRRAAPAVRGAEPGRRGARPRRGCRLVRSLDLRARAHARVPVPGRALAAGAHERPAAPLRGDAWRSASRAARRVVCRRCPIRRRLVEAFREGGLAALVQNRRTAGIDG